MIAHNPTAWYEDTHEKHLQVVYLYHAMNMATKEIAKITDYAVSTVKIYAKKFENLLNEAIKFFKKRISKPIEKKHCAYLISLKDIKNVNFQTKVGYTGYFNRRMKQLLRSYSKVADIEVIKIYYFEDEDTALMMESAMRKHFKKKTNAIFVPKDRFENIEVTAEDIKKLDEKYEKLLKEF